MENVTPNRLTVEGEAIWTDFQLALGWQQGFALVFLFSDTPTVSEIFRRRLAGIYRARVTGLRLLRRTPETPEELGDALLWELFRPRADEESRRAPLWVELTQGRGADWDAARANLLMRLNERRTPLTESHAWPVILVLPSAFSKHMYRYCPDLWTVRQQAVFLDGLLDRSAPAAPAHDMAPVQTFAPFPLPPEDEALREHWQRIAQTVERGSVIVGCRLSEALGRAGRWEERAEVDRQVLQLARELLTQDETPEALRDVSISLNNVGRTHEALGEWEAARARYEESLHMRRQLLARLGETPEALRDVSVSLDHVGRTHQALGDWEAAQACFQSGLELAERLAEAFPDLPEFNQLPDHFHQRLKDLEAASAQSNPTS